MAMTDMMMVAGLMQVKFSNMAIHVCKEGRGMMEG